MSLLGISNFLIFQWFFIRLGKIKHSNGVVKYKFFGYPVPLTGWRSDYVFVGKSPFE